MSKMTDALQKWIQQFESGIKWYGKLNSVQTKRTYLPNFKRYCDWTKKNPDELIELKLEGMDNRNTKKEWQAEDLLEKFLRTADCSDYVKKNIRTAVISFYKHNRRHLKEPYQIETPEPKTRTPKIQDIKDMENAFTFRRDKAMVWFISSATFRVETLTLLRWDDLKPTGDRDVPFYLLIEAERLKGKGKGKYRGVKQVGFLHSLAAKKLEAYKKELQRKGYIPTETSPIFIPYRKERKIKKMSTFSIERNFDKASLRAWENLEKKRFSPQDFRSFFQSACESAGIHPNIIAPMLAHKVRGVDFHYSDHDIEELLEKFKTALPWLLPQSLEALKAEQEKIRSEASKEIGELKHDLAKMLPLMWLIGEEPEGTEVVQNILKAWFNTENPDRALEISGDKQKRLLQINVTEEQAKLIGIDLGRIRIKNSENNAKKTGFNEIRIQIGKPKETTPEKP